MAQHFADGDKICVVLGDNIIEKDIRVAADRFRRQVRGASILLKAVPDPERFGVAEVSGDWIVGIEEKPKRPKTHYAVTGIYMYDATVFDKIHTLVPSGRGELEITDVNNAYVREGTLTFSYLDGWWTDAGTFDSLLRAANSVAKSRASHTLDRLGHRQESRAADSTGDLAPSPQREIASLGGLNWPAPGRKRD